MNDFYSDTKTKPSHAMLEYALGRNFGDEQQDEDPTTLELCERVAHLLGKESAVFLPSGTMCNEIAITVQTSPGDEIICRSFQSYRQFRRRSTGRDEWGDDTPFGWKIWSVYRGRC